MTLGTEQLIKVFEAFTKHHTSRKTFRKVFCESGQSARKSYMNVNESTRKRMDEITSKCSECQHSEMQLRTTVSLFEELAKIEPALLKEIYLKIGQSKKVYKLCNQKTQTVIQKMGLRKNTKIQGIPLMIQ